MIARCKSPAFLLLLLGFITLAPRLAEAEQTPAQDGRLKEIIAGDHRSAENKARDKYRNPYETLTFFGIKPDMTVVEIYPGRGWYTEILAPYLKGNGTLYAAEHPGDPSYEAVQRSLAAFDEMVKAKPELYGEVKRTKLTKDGDIAPPGSADLVVTFRNTHSWIGAGTADDAFATMYKALKPGGVLITHEPGEGHAIAPASIEAMRLYGVTERDMPPHLIIRRGEEVGFTNPRILPIPHYLHDIFYSGRTYPRRLLSKRRWNMTKRVLKMLFRPDAGLSAIVVLTK